MLLDNNWVHFSFDSQLVKRIAKLVNSYSIMVLNVLKEASLTTVISHFIIQIQKIQNYNIIFQISMEQLASLIKDASNEFECHNFQTSLSLYTRCVERCVEENLPKYVLYNLKSSKAALHTILGQYETALSVLNEVLSVDKQHFLCLIRRSQVYKKQSKYKKAMKDLDVLSMYAPDNMQVAALKLELQGLMSKANQSASQSSEQQQQKLDEQQVLKFSNLRKIDRTSVSIMLPKGRQSRVTITGDKSFFYESTNDDKQPIRQSKMFTPSFNQQRYIEIDKQLETTESLQKEQPAVIIKTKTQPTRTKSILRNRQSKLYIADKLIQQTKSQQQKLIEKVKDIDGHVIQANTASNNDRQVGFRKSLFAEEINVTELVPKQKKVKPKAGGRKSCLKRSSFSSVIEQQTKKGPRRSRFQSMSRSSIDGKVIKSDKKRKLQENEASKQNINHAQTSNNESDNDSEEGSQYNIFGSKKVFLNQQLRENLGIGSDSIVEDTPIVKKQKPARGQSILKKSSVILKKDSGKKNASVFFRQKEEQTASKPQRKAKKSVMFTS